MALIDEIGKENIEEKETSEKKCSICNVKTNTVNTELKICEACFNTQVNDALKKIDENLFKIKQEMTRIHQFSEELKKIMGREDIHLIIKNKAEIDLMNAEATLLKLKIDLDTNTKAYFVNQRQANEFRKINRWELFEINNKY